MIRGDWGMRTELDWMLSMGWFLLPVDGKRPTIKWRDQSSNEHEIVHGWFRHADGRLGVGVDTGRSELFVVDVDKGAGGFASLALLPEPLAPTLTVRTGGNGVHFYYRRPDDLELKNSAGRLPTAAGWLDLPGVDSRSMGGFVVAPPSRHRSGNRYRWIAGKQLHGPASLPDWIRPIEIRSDLGTKARTGSGGSNTFYGPGSSSRYVAAAVRSEISELRSARKGSRNDALVRSAFKIGTLIGPDGITRSEAEGFLEAAGLEIGLGEIETRNTVRSGLDAGSIRPRSIS